MMEKITIKVKRKTSRDKFIKDLSEIITDAYARHGYLTHPGDARYVAYNLANQYAGQKSFWIQCPCMTAYWDDSDLALQPAKIPPTRRAGKSAAIEHFLKLQGNTTILRSDK